LAIDPNGIYEYGCDAYGGVGIPLVMRDSEGIGEKEVILYENSSQDQDAGSRIIHCQKRLSPPPPPRKKKNHKLKFVARPTSEIEEISTAFYLRR